MRTDPTETGYAGKINVERNVSRDGFRMYASCSCRWYGISYYLSLSPSTDEWTTVVLLAEEDIECHTHY